MTAPRCEIFAPTARVKSVNAEDHDCYQGANMTDETLFTAARRLVRNLNADFASGLISQQTEAAAHTLQLMIDKENNKLKVVTRDLQEPVE